MHGTAHDTITGGLADWRTSRAAEKTGGEIPDARVAIGVTPASAGERRRDGLGLGLFAVLAGARDAEAQGADAQQGKGCWLRYG